MKIRKKRKITKEELKRDRFEETVLSLFDSFKKEPGKWGGILLVVVAVFVVLVLLNQKRITRSFQGERIFIQALTFLNAGQFQDAGNLFKQVYDGAKGSFEGKKATYYLGHMGLLKGSFQEAERYFKEYISSKPQDEFLEAAANEGLAVIYFYKNDKDRVLKYIDFAIQKAPFKFQKGYYFLRKIEMLKELGGDGETVLSMIDANRELWEKSVWEQEIVLLRDYFKGAVAAKGG